MNEFVRGRCERLRIRREEGRHASPVFLYETEFWKKIASNWIVGERTHCSSDATRILSFSELRNWTACTHRDRAQAYWMKHVVLSFIICRQKAMSDSGESDSKWNRKLKWSISMWSDNDNIRHNIQIQIKIKTNLTVRLFRFGHWHRTQPEDGESNGKSHENKKRQTINLQITFLLT